MHSLQVAPLDASAAAAAAQKHALLHYGTGGGIDAPQPTDLFYRLKIHQCFYVGGLGSIAAAEHLDAEAYRSAEPDPLRQDAPTLVSTFNRERAEDVLRVGAFAVRFCACDSCLVSHGNLLQGLKVWSVTA